MYCYSPRPMADYRIHALSECEVSVIAKQPRSLATSFWNLFWLSTPSIDGIPGNSNGQWWKIHTPIAGALAAVVTDIRGDEVLHRKLLMHPSRFLEWFERDDHSIYECYHVLGSSWPDTVIARGEEACLRLTPNLPRVFADTNGIRIEFTRTSDDAV
jgi:hypothetical protein